MKEFDHTNSEELDAGWDVGEPNAPAISVRQPKLAVLKEAMDDEIDAAWDSTPLAASAPSAKLDKPAQVAASVPPHLRNSAIQLHEGAAKKVVPVGRQATDDTTRRAHQLTKKERRTIERQQRLHAAQKQAQSKTEKKRQRKQVAPDQRGPLSDPPPIAKGAVVASPTNINKQRRKTKPRTEQRQQQNASAGNQPQRVAPQESRRSKPSPSQVPTSETAIDSAPQPSARKSKLPGYATIGVVILTLAWLWFYAGPR